MSKSDQNTYVSYLTITAELALANPTQLSLRWTQDNVFEATGPAPGA